MSESSSRDPIIIAHRGASAYLPEHSLAAKALALGMGADYLEQDIVTSRDGVPLVFHDLYLDALTDVTEKFPGRARDDGHYYCIDFAFEEIRELRLHERRDPRTGAPAWPGRFPPEAALFRIPTLDEELTMIRGLEKSTGGSIGIYPELKGPAWHMNEGVDLADAVLAVLDEHGYLAPRSPVFLQCFDAPVLERLRTDPRCGNVAMVQLIGSANSGLAGQLEAVSNFADAIGPSLSLFQLFEADGQTRAGHDLVAEAHACGLKVHPYTLRADALPKGCSTVDGLLALLFGELGADGVFTDCPDRVRAYLGGLGGASGSSGQR
jgi:glycerophosphoryl diester phosphodiesterase